ncbi:glycosyltransferase family 2 protein, partial [Bacteroides ovatus]|uniref:glycosyltransferase family 2 protein n=3 Tax=Bacteroides TaxID=816 RepID=UPI002030CB74
GNFYSKFKMNCIPKISALVITYKQEKLVRRAIDSLLQQKDFLYEICVTDDCSPDNTWEVLQGYSKQYPGLFKLHRNEPNVGIFQNVEQSWTMPTGDLVYQLSGDDECPGDWFKTVVDYINENQINYLDKRICIYGDIKCLYPNGDYFIRSNKMVTKPFELVSMHMRHLIGNRSACYSTAIMKKFFSVSKGRSYVAEWAQEIQLTLFTEKAYYINMVGNVYYTRIGVNIGFNKEILKERADNFPYMAECLEKAGYQLSTKDQHYIKLQKLRYEQIANWSLTNFLKIQLLKHKVTDYRYGFFYLEFKSLKRKLFAVLRRLPHKNPITITI